MTTINWKELTPEQRDRIVAEKIFNWQPVPCDAEDLTIYDDGEAFCYKCHKHEHVCSFEHGVIAHPTYTTSMDAAWLVVKEMQKLHPVWHFPEFVEELVVFADEKSAYCLLEAISPERICIAAMRAAGHTVEIEE